MGLHGKIALVDDFLQLLASPVDAVTVVRREKRALAPARSPQTIGTPRRHHPHPLPCLRAVRLCGCRVEQRHAQERHNEGLHSRRFFRYVLVASSLSPLATVAMSKRARFGRVRIRLEELEPSGVVDFAKLLEAKAPAHEHEGARRATAFLSAGVGVSVQDQLVLHGLPAAEQCVDIPGEDMSDEDDNRGVGKKARGGRGIYESIIAKWSSLSAPDAGKDSDEGGGSGEEYEDGQDSGD